MNTEPLQDFFSRGEKEGDLHKMCVPKTEQIKMIGESASDYLLPDYLGDVRRILSVEAEAIPAGKFQSGDSVEFSGIVSYRVLYADAENRLNEARFTSDYEFDAPVDRETYLDCVAKVGVAACNMRLSGPRKFAAKTSLTCEIQMQNEIVFEPFADLQDGAKPEILTQTARIMTLQSGQSAEREYAEEAYVKEGVAADALEIVGTSSGLRIDSAKIADNTVNVNGTLLLRAVLRENNRNPFTVEKEIAVEQSIPMESVKPNAEVAADGTVTSFTASVTAHDGGVAVTFNAIAQFSAAAYENRETEIVTDAFLCEAQTEADCGALTYRELCGFCGETATLEGNVTLEEVGAESACDILSSDAAVKIASCRVVGGDAVIEGTVSFRAVTLSIDENGENLYQNPRFEKDFTLRVKCAGASDEAKAVCSLLPYQTEITLDRDKMYGRCNANLTVLVTEDREMTRLVSLRPVPNENFAPTAGIIRVYYPTENDTLFAVAKKYHTPTAKIAADNALTAEVSLSPGTSTLSSVKKLVIR